jgi:tetratricopeptide (TPR) repeat protein
VFFRKLVTPPAEQALVAGIKEILAGSDERALDQLRKATQLPDAAFMAGVLALKSGSFSEAVTDLDSALRSGAELGKMVARYKATLTVSLQITPLFTAHLPMNAEGAGLALAEAYQRQKNWSQAVATLEGVRKVWPDDPVVLVSLAELLLDSAAGNRAALQRVVDMTNDVRNLTPVHTALSLYRARALRALGLPDAAAQTLTNALALRKDRSLELLLGLRYERALAYAESGQAGRSRTEFERIYAEEPHYEDVATRLGLT